MKRLLIGGCLGMISLILAAQGLHPPAKLFSRSSYIAQVEFTEYGADGVTVVDRYFMTLYLDNGAEIAISEDFPARPLRTAARNIVDTVGLAMYMFRRSAGYHQNRTNAWFVSAGCVLGGEPIVGNDQILNFATVATQNNTGRERLTIWNAPDLDCFALKFTEEDKRADGGFVLRRKRQAVRVDRNL